MIAMRDVFSLVLAAILCLSNSPANAAQYIATFTGVVDGGRDISGVFGNPRTDLAGKAFTAKYILSFPTDPPIYAFKDDRFAQVLGGSLYGTPNQLVGSITIGNATFGFGDTGYYGAALQGRLFSGANTVYYLLHDSGLQGNSLNISFESKINNIFAVPDLISNVDYTLAAEDTYRALFDITKNGIAGGTLKIQTYQVRPFVINPAPVPEPSTWAFMLTGFALVGGVMRRSSRRWLALR